MKKLEKIKLLLYEIKEHNRWRKFVENFKIRVKNEQTEKRNRKLFI